MEKYYLIKNDCKTGKNYWAYKKARIKMSKAFNDFAIEHNIEASQYHPTTNVLWILPTLGDRIKFRTEFKNNEPGKFKRSSILNRKWVSKCKKEKLKYISEPYLPFLFDCPTECKYRLFDIDDKIFCTFDAPTIDKTPKGFEEVDKDYFYALMRLYNIKLD